MHSVALIHPVALSNDSIFLESSLHRDIAPDLRGQDHFAGKVKLGVHVPSGAIPAGTVHLCIRHRLPRRIIGTLHPFSTSMYPFGPQMLGTWTSV